MKSKEEEYWINDNLENDKLMELYNNYTNLKAEIDFIDYEGDYTDFTEYLLSHSVNEDQDRLLNDRYEKLKKICKYGGSIISI